MNKSTSVSIQKTAQYLLAKADASGDHDPAELQKVSSVAAGIISALASGIVAPGSVGTTMGEKVKGFGGHLKNLLTSPNPAAAYMGGGLQEKLPGMLGAYITGHKYGLGGGLAGVGSQYFLGQSAQQGSLKNILKGVGGDVGNQNTALRAMQFGAPIATGALMHRFKDWDKDRE
jgi:hypothetical protein